MSEILFSVRTVTPLFKFGWSGSPPPALRPCSALYLTFCCGQTTITDIVLVRSQSLFGLVPLPHAMLLLLLLLLLAGENCWIKPVVSGWEHTGGRVRYDDFSLSDVSPLLLRGACFSSEVIIGFIDTSCLLCLVVLILFQGVLIVLFLEMLTALLSSDICHKDSPHFHSLCSDCGVQSVSSLLWSNNISFWVMR